MSEAEATLPTPPANIHRDRPVGPLTRSRLTGGDYARTIHVAQVEKGTPESRFLEPDYWKMVSQSLKLGDRIEVYCEAMTFFAELMVTSVGTNYAKVQLLRFHELTSLAPVPQTNPDYEIKWGGNYQKWAVIRIEDRAIVKDGIADEETARRELRDLTIALRR